jgi:hypothetical protein
MADLIDRPPAGIVLDEELLKGYDSFPGNVFLISVGGDKYACNNATLTDGQKINGLACFPSADDATAYMGLLGGLSGSIVGKSFEEAREIAIAKPVLSALFLFVDGKIIDVHYIR